MSKQWKNDLQSLYQQTRQERPAAALDKKIRLAAQKAVQRKGPNLKWYLSSAAVVLLAVNVVLFTYVPEPEIIEIPQKSYSRPLYKPQPDVAIPQTSPAPVMEPNFYSSENQEMQESGVLFSKEAKRSLYKSRKEVPQSPEVYDLYSDSIAREMEQASQPEVSSRVSGAFVQAEKIRYPQYLPFDVTHLIAGNSNLTGHQSTQTLEINQNHKLILRMEKSEQGTVIVAYAEAKIWGIYAEWGQSNQGLKNCTGKEPVICDLNNEVQGGFEKGRLIFIRWLQKSEP